MTIAALEKKLKPLEAPVDNDLLRWLRDSGDRFRGHNTKFFLTASQVI